MLAALLLALAPLQEPTGEPGPALAEQVALILLRAEEPDDKAIATAARELAALPEVTPVLLDVVGRASTGGPDEVRLAPRQLELARQALQLSAGPGLAAFVREVEGDPRTPERIAAALRIAARQGRDGLAQLTRLARAAEKVRQLEAVESVFEAALDEQFSADPTRVRRLSAPFTDLSPGGAAVVVRAVGRTGAADALACLRGVLGRRSELDGSLLLELARLAPLAGGAEAQELCEEVLPYLRADAAGEVQAAATLLGRLAQPQSVPALIEVLVDEDPSSVRAALTALRAIGGVSLPASPEAWRSWYGREETWWLERASRLFGPLEFQDEELGLAEVSARLREISEHKLHRRELVQRLAPLLSHPRSRVRVLVCECLARLGSATALGELAPLLEDRSSEVVEAARRAIEVLAPSARGSAHAD